MVERQLPKLHTRVRFPSPALPNFGDRTRACETALAIAIFPAKPHLQVMARSFHDNSIPFTRSPKFRESNPSLRDCPSRLARNRNHLQALPQIMARSRHDNSIPFTRSPSSDFQPPPSTLGFVPLSTFRFPVSAFPPPVCLPGYTLDFPYPIRSAIARVFRLPFLRTSKVVAFTCSIAIREA